MLSVILYPNSLLLEELGESPALLDGPIGHLFLSHGGPSLFFKNRKFGVTAK